MHKFSCLVFIDIDIFLKLFHYKTNIYFTEEPRLIEVSINRANNIFLLFWGVCFCVCTITVRTKSSFRDLYGPVPVELGQFFQRAVRVEKNERACHAEPLKKLREPTGKI